MKLERVIIEVRNAKRRIAQERDMLRELITDAEQLFSNCESAEDSLNRAIDALSELV